MRFVKLAVISIVALFGVILLISLLLPSTVRISRAIDINAPVERLYPLLGEITRWKDWNEYVRNYPQAVITSTTLHSPDISIEITGSNSKLVSSAWQAPGGNLFQCGYAIYGSNKRHLTCTVQWYFSFHVRWYPWEKLQSIVYDQQFGPIMEHSLVNLKRIAENVN